MKVIVYILVFIVTFVIFVWYVEQASVFYPVKELAATPDRIGLDFEDVFFSTGDNVKVHGWLVKHPNAKSVLLFFHGNAGNIGDRLDKIKLFHDIGLDVLIVDYRGYGRSEGRPTEKGIYLDAVAAYDHLRKRADTKDKNIILYGASLGGAVAVDLATKRDVSCLIADSTFSSATDIAKRLYPFIPSFLIRTKMDSLGKIKALTLPKLFIHSKEDSIVPFTLGKRLFDAAPPPKEMFEIMGDHNDGFYQNEDLLKGRITIFLRSLQLLG